MQLLSCHSDLKPRKFVHLIADESFFNSRLQTINRHAPRSPQTLFPKIPCRHLTTGLLLFYQIKNYPLPNIHTSSGKPAQRECLTSCACHTQTSFSVMRDQRSDLTRLNNFYPRNAFSNK